jgi:hypothetical protein
MDKHTKKQKRNATANSASAENGTITNIVSPSVVSPPPKKARHQFTLKEKKTVNLRAFQIKGEELQGGILTAYFQKSINSEKVEQPYDRELVRKIETDTELRECDLGISLLSSRRTSPTDNTLLPPNPALVARGLKWHVFIANKSDVGSLQQWLQAVEARLNEDDIRCNEKLFKYAPTFQVTSWGTKFSMDGTFRTLQHLVPDEEVYQIVTQLHELSNPYKRISVDTLPFGTYFVDPQKGKESLLSYLETTFDNN